MGAGASRFNTIIFFLRTSTCRLRKLRRSRRSVSNVWAQRGESRLNVGRRRNRLLGCSGLSTLGHRSLEQKTLPVCDPSRIGLAINLLTVHFRTHNILLTQPACSLGRVVSNVSLHQQRELTQLLSERFHQFWTGTITRVVDFVAQQPREHHHLRVFLVDFFHSRSQSRPLGQHLAKKLQHSSIRASAAFAKCQAFEKR